MLVVLPHHFAGGVTVDILASVGRAFVDASRVDRWVIELRIVLRISRDLHHLHYHLQFLFSSFHLLVDMVSRVVAVPIIIRAMLSLILLHRIHILQIRIIQAVIRAAILRILEDTPRILLILLADRSGIREFSHSKVRLLRATQDRLDSLILRVRVVVCLDERFR